MNSIAAPLISWYLKNKRDLPWRHTTNPYHIWVSEVILQQTRVDQGLPYYFRFLEEFPSVFELAAAPEDHVLKVWQGLGYYSRARNMQTAAKTIVAQFQGEFPSSFVPLKQLKGIGPYTAAAVASFAFHEDVAVVDGNVMRVISRLNGIEEDITKPKTRKLIEAVAQNYLPEGQSYLFNQAIMELGALVCLPQKPKCDQCPLQLNCTAFKRGIQSQLPIKSKLKKRKERFFAYFLLEDDCKFFLTKRPEGDIWQGLYEPFSIELESMPEPDLALSHLQTCLKLYSSDFEVLAQTRIEKHILSHQELYASLFHLKLKSLDSISHLDWFDSEEVDKLPKPVLILKLLKQL